jgi:16S rRNA (guanine(527)-N(7))-methyltransferase RsmG
VRAEFTETLKKNASLYGVAVSGNAVDHLWTYFEIVQRSNPLLHLVGPCSPAEFATRHILESLTLLKFLPDRTNFVDVGAGAGLPSIPCLLVRTDLRAMLIESKLKKARFLEEAIEDLGIADRASVVDRQFEETEPGRAAAVTCRALDKFTEKVPRLIKWSKTRRILLFGGPALRPKITAHRHLLSEQLMPLSEQRYLFVA